MKKSIERFVKKLKYKINVFLVSLDEPFYGWVICLYNFLKGISSPEKKQSFGDENPDKIFYVIRLNWKGVGWATFFETVIGFAILAEKKGWIPIVDFSSDEIAIYDKKIKGNPWEYFFKQYEDFNLATVYKSKNVVICNEHKIVQYKRINKKNVLARNQLIKKFKKNEEFELYCENKIKDIWGNYNGENVLGVYYRGSDYNTIGSTIPGMPLMKNYELFQNELREYIYNKKISCVFLISEEKEVIEFLIENNKNINIQFIEHPRYSRKDNFDISISDRTPNNISRYENDRYYLCDLFLLSKCNYLFAPLTTGTTMAINLNGWKYKDIHIVNNGRNK